MILPRSPIFGQPNYDFDEDYSYSDINGSSEDTKNKNQSSDELTHMAFWYMVVLIVMLFTWLLVFFCLRMIALRQKTRSSQQRRVCVGARTRQLSVQEPSIYVSPANLSPPPKYEAMAPPSYEEVVGVHYPGYQSQPITQPITHALSSQSTSSAEPNATASSTAPPPAVITVTTEQRRTSADVRS
ncbi:unnamed protein product [Diatraea saccharalis]|uniref:Uncharacterized protein n=1 Tax=Diatraea saccharalis TaxID=40085 RepID=A0A9N9R9W5_9NEOP|nr:unnamed protein product [Diatraea saccharalis]